MTKFCAWCGQQVADDAVFCPNCGKRADGSDAAAQQSPMQQGTQQQMFAQQMGPQQSYGTARPNKGGMGFTIGIIAAALALVVGVGGFVWPGFFHSDKEAAVEESSDRESAQREERKTDRDDKADTSGKIEKDKDEDEEKDKDKDDEGAKDTGDESIEDEEIAITVSEEIGEEDDDKQEAPFVNPFTDVKEGEWYYDALMWAGKNGIVGGTTFDPNGKATRAGAHVPLACGGQSDVESPRQPVQRRDAGQIFLSAGALGL